MLISNQSELDKLYATLKGFDYITIDTEFLRDKTYYPKLCLIQMAGPGTMPAAVDPLAEGLDLSPVFDLLANEKITKVFHAARQDIEIFYNLTGDVPRAIFDTQVAAMVADAVDPAGKFHGLPGICLAEGATAMGAVLVRCYSHFHNPIIRGLACGDL